MQLWRAGQRDSVLDDCALEGLSHIPHTESEHIMPPRPTAVTVISWILIILSAFSLIATLATLGNPALLELLAKSPIPIPIQYAMSIASAAVTMSCAVAMLRGVGWARLLYVVSSTISLTIGFATSPFKASMIPATVVLAIFTALLYRPKSNAFFSKKPAS